jgi:sugar lactone lactonase YvrE
LAQPSGLHWHDGILYFADSESSTVRAADITTKRVHVIAGTTENNLFAFGDADGKTGESLLQHALGVTANDDGSLVYIADTYNSKIRVYDVESEETTTLFGLTDNGGYRDGDSSVAQFDEPGGLDYANGLLYVADTNNHVIRIIDLESSIVDTLEFPNPEALVIERDEVTILGSNAADELEIQYDTQTLTAGDGELTINFTLPDGYKINELIDSVLELSVDGDAVSFDDNHFVIDETSMTIPLELSAGEATLSLDVTLFYCEEDTVCLIDEATLQLPVSVSEDSESSVMSIEREVQLPEALR